AYLNLGNVLIATGRNAEAESDLQQALVLLPEGEGQNAAGRYMGVARSADHLGDSALREQALAAAAQVRGGPEMVDDFRGERLLQEGDEADAVALLRATVARSPDDLQAWMLLAAALERLGDISGAAAACRTALTLGPDEKVRAGLQQMLARLIHRSGGGV
ncbi:MAG TPA: tetratricopeptide repeat protein, partial [Candidatus Binataceae bacterium]|nr:tetratricopeptide repeat protein [Candidatus Binataceae bacterium]